MFRSPNSNSTVRKCVSPAIIHVKNIIIRNKQEPDTEKGVLAMKQQAQVKYRWFSFEASSSPVSDKTRPDTPRPRFSSDSSESFSSSDGEAKEPALKRMKLSHFNNLNRVIDEGAEETKG